MPEAAKIRHKHLPELQSLRGIAAVVVLFHHGAFLFDTSETFHLATEALFNAHAAVMIFFVLSGYVLTQSLLGSHFDFKSIGRFYIRRAFRIYPAIVAVSILSGLYLMFVHREVPAFDVSSWYLTNYRAGLPGPEGWALSLLGWRNELIPPLWTVRVEICASVALPPLAYVIHKGFGLALLAATAVLLFALTGSIWMYLFSFAIGGYAANLRPQLKKYASLPLLLSAVLFMYFFRLLDSDWRFEADVTAALPTLMESAAAAIVVANIAALDISFLRAKALVWLGDISYSVYLVHFVILSLWAKWIGRSPLHAEANALLLMAATFLTTLPVAHVLYQFVELPGIAAGRKFLDRFAGSSRAAEPVPYLK